MMTMNGTWKWIDRRKEWSIVRPATDDCWWVIDSQMALSCPGVHPICPVPEDLLLDVDRD